MAKKASTPTTPAKPKKAAKGEELTPRQLAAQEKAKKKEASEKLQQQANDYKDKMFSSTLLETLDLIGTTEILDAVETQFHIAVSSTDTDARKATRVSTGLLMTDMMLAGGIYGGGWYTILGPEGSCKTTQLISWVAKLYESDVPIIAWWDYEGCFVAETEVKLADGSSESFSNLINAEWDNLKDLVATADSTGKSFFYRGSHKPPQVAGHDGSNKEVIIFYGGKKPCVKLSLDNGDVLEGFHHPVLIVRNDQLMWVTLEDIKLSDLVVTSNV